MANPTPVLPDVGSTIVPPGFSFPSRSAASIIASPIRSLTEPPGLRNSSFASTRAPPGGERRGSRTIGVSPTSSRSDGYSRGIALSLAGARAAFGAPAGEQDEHDDAERGADDARDD